MGSSGEALSLTQTSEHVPAVCGRDANSRGLPCLMAERMMVEN